jgi:hypothetical protein
MTVTNTSTVSKTIHPNNAYLVRSKITFYNSTTNQFVPWTGLANVSVSFYEDALGTQTIAGLSGLGMSEVTNTGVYYVVVPAANTAILGTTYTGDTVYQIVTGGTNNAIKVVTPLAVTQPRYAQPGAE